MVSVTCYRYHDNGNMLTGKVALGTLTKNRFSVEQSAGVLKHSVDCQDDCIVAEKDIRVATWLLLVKFSPLK